VPYGYLLELKPTDQGTLGCEGV